MKKKIQKPFDAEAAKGGARVETREGRSVRIVCYDMADIDYPIVALIDYQTAGESCNTFTTKGELVQEEANEEDLVIIEEVEVSKFKVGEVIVNPDYVRPWFIIATSPDYYMLQDTQGNKTEMYQIIVDNYYRLWTLEDAKPGDVLICEEDNSPFIFRGLSYDYIPSAFCGIDDTDTLLITTGDNAWTHMPVRPATDTEEKLFYKILEKKGYKWNSNTLTLSKIEKWRDKKGTELNGYFISLNANILSYDNGALCENSYNVFATKKQAKSALAMAQISQIMANDKRFGGAVIYKEWTDKRWFAIIRINNNLEITSRYGYEFLAFHTKEQAELFLKENEDLVKDYYMLD